MENGKKIYMGSNHLNFDIEKEKFLKMKNGSSCYEVKVEEPDFFFLTVTEMNRRSTLVNCRTYLLKMKIVSINMMKNSM